MINASSSKFGENEKAIMIYIYIIEIDCQLKPSSDFFQTSGTVHKVTYNKVRMVQEGLDGI